MKLVTGGAGFLGSHLVDALVASDGRVGVVDNFSTSTPAWISRHTKTGAVQVTRGDVNDADTNRAALGDVDEVWHLAADPDVRAGAEDPHRHFRDGVQATWTLLESMRKADVSRIVYASSSTVYGEASRLPTPEDYGPLLPISPYGAAKLAGEAAIASYCGTYGFRSWIFRFGNVVGPRLSHGVIRDFAAALGRDASKLTILGDGRQQKSYLSTADCVAGMRHARERATHRVNVFNLASEDATTVDRIAAIVIDAMGANDVSIVHTGGDRGWPGDVPRMHLAIDAMKSLGWRPQHTSDGAVALAAQSVAATLVEQR